MKIPHLWLTLSALALSASSLAFAQATEKCPTVWVDGPTSDVTYGTPIVFTARLTGVNPTARPEFRWEVLAGTLVSGQGTSSVNIDTVGLGGVTVTAKVIVTGISTTCPTEASRSSNVYPEGIICALPFDSYGEIRFEDEEARLDNFVIQLFNEKKAKGYIFVYAGRRTYEGEAAERLLRAKQYLVEKRKMSAERIVTVDGGYKEDLETTLIIAPQDAVPPVPMPTLSPGEIELTKPHPKGMGKKGRD